jgi:hypothetical protein
MKTQVGLILEAKDIPDNTVVTKITGEKEYVLRHELKVYSHMGANVYNEISLDFKPLFLIARADCSIRAIDPDTKLKVSLALSGAIEFLQNVEALEEERNHK